MIVEQKAEDPPGGGGALKVIIEESNTSIKFILGFDSIFWNSKAASVDSREQLSSCLGIHTLYVGYLQGGGCLLLFALRSNGNQGHFCSTHQIVTIGKGWGWGASAFFSTFKWEPVAFCSTHQIVTIVKGGGGGVLPFALRSNGNQGHFCSTHEKVTLRLIVRIATSTICI